MGIVAGCKEMKEEVQQYMDDEMPTLELENIVELELSGKLPMLSLVSVIHDLELSCLLVYILMHTT